MAAKKNSKVATAPPIALDAKAQAIWDEVAPELIETGRLVKSNARAFAVYCKIFSRLSDLLDEAAGAQTVLATNNNKTACMNPIYKTLDMVHSWALHGIREFGLSPSSIRGISEPAIDPNDEAFAADFD